MHKERKNFVFHFISFTNKTQLQTKNYTKIDMVKSKKIFVPTANKYNSEISEIESFPISCA